MHEGRPPCWADPQHTPLALSDCGPSARTVAWRPGVFGRGGPTSLVASYSVDSAGIRWGAPRARPMRFLPFPSAPSPSPPHPGPSLSAPSWAPTLHHPAAGDSVLATVGARVLLGHHLALASRSARATADGATGSPPRGRRRGVALGVATEAAVGAVAAAAAARRPRRCLVPLFFLRLGRHSPARQLDTAC